MSQTNIEDKCREVAQLLQEEIQSLDLEITKLKAEAKSLKEEFLVIVRKVKSLF